jgi:cytochrome c-type biogenesis protein
MLVKIFTWLTQALYADAALALFAAFAWGVLSILLSPCHLASIPLIIGFISGQGRVPVKRAFGMSALFSAGILLTIGIIGLITGMLGRMLGDIGPWGKYFVAAVFFAVGLILLDIIPVDFAAADVSWYRKKGFFPAFVLGLVFGIALGPCTFAFMAPMLGVVFSVAARNFIFAAALVFAYALGHCSVIIVAGTYTEKVEQYLGWNEKSRGLAVLKKICGILVLLGGIYLIAS